jgi:hypothetical protein
MGTLISFYALSWKNFNILLGPGGGGVGGEGAQITDLDWGLPCSVCHQEIEGDIFTVHLAVNPLSAQQKTVFPPTYGIT